MKELVERVQQQNENRREWVRNDTPHSVAKQIVDEAHELVGAIEQFDALPNAEYNLIGEVGDVLYLALKLCADLGIDPEQAVELKLTRNSVKYPDHILSNGMSYEAARALSKSLWEAMGGDNAFYLWHSLIYPLDE